MFFKLNLITLLGNNLETKGISNVNLSVIIVLKVAAREIWKVVKQYSDGFMHHHHPPLPPPFHPLNFEQQNDFFEISINYKLGNICLKNIIPSIYP